MSVLLRSGVTRATDLGGSSAVASRSVRYLTARTGHRLIFNKPPQNLHPTLRSFHQRRNVFVAIHPPALTAALTNVSPTQSCLDATNAHLYAVNSIATSLGSVRHFGMSPVRWEQASSKVEETVKAIQEKEKDKITVATQQITSEPAKVVAKKTLAQKVWHEIVHYYHGFRLLFIDINVARKLLFKVLRGKSLTRREYMLLIRTTGDVFRLVPFSVFIIVPFMEILLPVFIKFFPGMLPSTFETAKDKEDKARQNLKVKLEMAKFLQKTLDEMDVSNKEHSSEEAKDFIQFFRKLQTAGERATPEEIMRFSKLFEDEITLDSLSREQLAAICKVLEVSTIGTSNLMRFQLRMKLRSLAADDRLIQKETVESLSLGELQAASRARGMRSYGLSVQELQNQITEWINLSLNEKVPPSLLLLSRAMMLPEDVPTSEKLKVSISQLSESAAIQTKAAIGEREGKIDNKTKIDIIRDEQRKIKEELDEQNEVDADKAKTQVPVEAEVLVDKAPIVSAKSAEPSSFTSTDMQGVSDAIDAIGAQKKTLLMEKEEIKDLKEEIADYKEDVEELKLISKQTDAPSIKESNASKNLLKKVDSMISKLDKVLEDLEAKEALLQVDQQTKQAQKDSELVRIDEIISAIRKMQKVPDEAKVAHISKMLGKIDDDQDGHLKVDDVLRIIEEIGKESIALNEKQVDELIELISKEEQLENEQKIEKALAAAKVIAAEQKTQVTDTELLTDKATKVLTTVDSPKKADGSEEKLKQPSKLNRSLRSYHLLEEEINKIDKRINESVILKAEEVASQLNRILPPGVDPSKPIATPKLPTDPNTKNKTL